LVLNGSNTEDIINIESGVSTTLLQIADLLLEIYPDKKPAHKVQVVGKYRVGDIRHYLSDTTKSTQWLGFSAEISLREGMSDWMNWAQAQKVRDIPQRAELEL
jgi:dTDP-L-rhamnose 4-epimerase